MNKSNIVPVPTHAYFAWPRVHIFHWLPIFVTFPIIVPLVTLFTESIFKSPLSLSPSTSLLLPLAPTVHILLLFACLRGLYRSLITVWFKHLLCVMASGEGGINRNVMFLFLALSLCIRVLRRSGVEVWSVVALDHSSTPPSPRCTYLVHGVTSITTHGPTRQLTRLVEDDNLSSSYDHSFVHMGLTTRPSESQPCSEQTMMTMMTMTMMIIALVISRHNITPMKWHVYCGRGY